MRYQFVPLSIVLLTSLISLFSATSDSLRIQNTLLGEPEDEISRVPIASVPIGFHLDWADNAHIEAAHRAGGKFVVSVFNWANIEPTPGYLYWEATDAALRAAEFYDIGVVARLDRPPVWALDADSPTPWSLDAYATFVHRVVARYGERLDGIILWNEPNLQLEWHDQTPDPVAYVALLRAGAEAARTANPTLPIFMAGLAFTEGGDGNLNDLGFLRAVYNAGGADYFDGLALHPYGFGAPPDTPPGTEVLNFRRLELHRQIMAVYGDGDKPVWITEMGWRVRAPDPADAWQVVTPEQQARYLQRAIELVATEYPWIERMAFWQLVARGDRYGFDLWQGAEEESPAYRALVAACRHRGGCGQILVGPRVAATPVGILAPDVIVRLGDRGTLHPHWVHLYNGTLMGDQQIEEQSLRWQGEFYLNADDATRTFDLLLETMQIDQSLNQLVINDIVIGNLAPRTRPDPTSTWVTQRLTVPQGVLQPGVNTITLQASPRNPAWQYDYWRWENFQVRNIRLQPSQETPLSFFRRWQRLPDPAGSADIIRLRPGTDGSLWVTGNRLGQLWRTTPTEGELTNQVGSHTTHRFYDVVEWNGITIAATDQGLFYRRTDTSPWRRFAHTPTQTAYVVAIHKDYLYAGFGNKGVWRATRITGPWQHVGLFGETVRDLVSTETDLLYAATGDAVYQLSTAKLSEQQVRQPTERPHWERLPALPEVAESQFVTRLYSGDGDEIVARIRDRFWRWDGVTWIQFGPLPERSSVQQNAVTNCCGTGTLIGGLDIPVLQQSSDGEWLPLSADTQTLAPIETMDLLRIDNQIIAAGTTGVFSVSVNEGQWQLVEGLPAIVSQLLIDPRDSQRWFAATPVGLHRSTDGGQTWSAITPPWIIYDMAWGNEGRLYLARRRGVAWSDNVAAATVNWKEVDGYERVLVFTVSPHPTDPAQLWAGTWGNDIGVSNNNGLTMQGLGSGLETLSVLDIWWHEIPGQITIGTIAGLYRSDDGGNNWFQLPGSLMQQTVYAIQQTPDGTLWAGAADGLWRSEDWGVSWTRVAAIPTVTVIRMGTIVDPQGETYLWIGAERNGWWFSQDGIEWHFGGLEERSVFSVTSTQMSGSEEDNSLLVVATDDGIWRTNYRHTGWSAMESNQ